LELVTQYGLLLKNRVRQIVHWNLMLKTFQHCI